MQNSTKVDHYLDVYILVFGSLKSLGLGPQSNDEFAVATLVDGTYGLEK